MHCAVGNPIGASADRVPKMIVITGGAGFIGSNLLKALNARGRRDILVVDNLSNGDKFRNIADCDILDYQDRNEFAAALRRTTPARWPDAITHLFHQGACSATTEIDGRYVMTNNYTYSKELLHFCLDERVAFIYASSAAVYGAGRVFREAPEYETPLNIYAYSKYLFDNYVRHLLSGAAIQVVGLRYFNVYGPREQHKGAMASIAFQLNRQLLDDGRLRLFEGSGSYGDGEQRRDFVWVDDAVEVNLWFLDHPGRSGIFNVGTGRSRSFNEVAGAVLSFHGHGRIEYADFPEHLKARYQDHTEADLTALRAAGYVEPFTDIEDGMARYLAWLNR
jgi:ADP-L-glycero-D-manno-heptose 6-epimerase